ncbi:MAG: hypothetical protein HY822_20990 [Acidobacteria bacterium]|nr:hypothetical protein [Acidobacteriota bacterium]
MRVHPIAIPIWLAAAAAAQPTAAPTPVQVGSVRGDNVGDYNVTSAFEAGYRFRSVGGNLGKYRGDVNFGNGMRLLSGSLTVHSREGHGGLFDEIALSTLGLGNDPYQHSNLRVQKNGLYRYDLVWRLSEYYNPALPIAFGQHAAGTVRRLQDHDFVLFPQSALRLFAGYSRNSQDGPALTTVMPFASASDTIPLFADVRRLRNEFRLGGEVTVKGVRLNVLRGWDRFAENTTSTGASFRRAEPYRGSSPYWRTTLAADRKLWAANGRFSHTDGLRHFYFEEMAAGTGRFGAALNRQILVAGDGRRPVTTGNLSLTLFPASRLTLTNHTACHSTRMEGDSVYREVNNSTALDNLLQFRYLGIRAISNLTDASFRAHRWVTLYGGYHFSTRRIRSRERQSVGDFSGLAAAEQDNRLHAGLAGLRLQPAKPLRISLDAEVGRAGRPFYPIGERNYHALGGRIQYKTRNLQLTAATRANYNTNSVVLSAHSSRARNYSFDGSWTARSWLSLDAGYSRLHLDTVSGLAFFALGSLQNQRYAYRSDLGAVHGGARVALRSRADLWAGYSRVEDRRDFALTFESPMARFSLRLTPKLRWNAAYQHYRYGEPLLRAQDYRAHTGYTSLLWAF